MNNKWKDRLMGTGVTLASAVIIFLATSFLNGFATKAEVGLVRGSIISIKTTLDSIEEDVKIIKEYLIKRDTKKPAK